MSVKKQPRLEIGAREAEAIRQIMMASASSLPQEVTPEQAEKLVAKLDRYHDRVAAYNQQDAV